MRASLSITVKADVEMKLARSIGSFVFFVLGAYLMLEVIAHLADRPTAFLTGLSVLCLMLSYGLFEEK